MSTAPPPPAAPRERLAWVDMARGVCVLAVVLVHVGFFHAFPLSGSTDGRPVLKLWEVLNTAVLAELRMPLLLFLSGWLASSKIRAGLGSGRTRLAILTNLYLFVVWSLVYVGLELLLGLPDRPVISDARSPGEFVLGLLHPHFGPLWFVWLLALTIFVLAALRRLPPPLVLLLLFAVGWGVERLTDDVAGLPRAVFFAIGAYYGTRIKDSLDSRPFVVGCVFAAGVLTVGAQVVPDSLSYPLGVVACLPVSVVFLALARWLSRWSALRRPSAWVGRRTLGVYVLHWPLVGGLVLLGRAHPGPFEALLRVDLLAIVYPLAATAVVAVACLLLETLLERVGLGVLFDPPRRLRELVAGGPVGAGRATAGGVTS